MTKPKPMNPSNRFELQPTSYEIWDSKYRLKNEQGQPIDQTIEDTFKRVAGALAKVEIKQEYWYEKFLWAMLHGAIPAGRIMSNAGAEQYKPNTSTINCVVSSTIEDNMDSILTNLRDAGMTLKNGSGIGYEFSTLRPKGAYVAGAGGYTSGPLSFIDIYDKMCFTISSAGGRRGAQMATFDIRHPDVIEFIQAKREDGRLRQFNLSLLITHDFMEAVKENKEWKFTFPLGSDTVYKTIPARELWNLIMQSNYEYAEPGFLLIDEINRMNNNWWCEEVRATNPCVAEGTLVATPNGLMTVGSLKVGDEIITAHGTVRNITSIETHDAIEVFAVRLANGAMNYVTADHIFHTKNYDPESINVGAWRDDVRVRDLKIGDIVRLVELNNFQVNRPFEKKSSRIESITPAGRYKVYDIYESTTDTWLTEGGLVSRGCGEQPLPQNGSCLLGSIDLTQFVTKPFTSEVFFDWGTYTDVIRIFTRMLDNVVEINGLPLESQRKELELKRRHGMGYFGLGSVFSMMGMSYGSPQSVELTQSLTETLAIEGYIIGLDLAKEKGPAPIMDMDFEVTEELRKKRPDLFEPFHPMGDFTVKGKFLHANSAYMSRIGKLEPELIAELAQIGCRFTHHTSIAPTGCVRFDTLVMTDNGLEFIENIGDKEGQQWQELKMIVGTDCGNKQATHFFVNGYKPTLVLKTSTGKEIEATPNHQLRVISNDGIYIWKRFDEINVGDIAISLVNNYHRKQDEITLNEVKSNLPLDHWHNRSLFKSPKFLNEDISELVGFLHSNGNVKSIRHVRFFHHVDYSDSVFDKIDKTLLDNFNLYGKRIHDCKRECSIKVNELHVHSTDFTSWLKINGLSKSKSSENKIPDLILKSGRKNIYAYLRGYFEGDGSASGNGITLTSASKEMIDVAQILLQSVGIVSTKNISVHEGDNSHKGGDIFRLGINHNIDRMRYMKEIGFISSKGTNLNVPCKRNSERRQLNKDVKKSLHKFFNTNNNIVLKNKLVEFESSINEELHYEVITGISNSKSFTYDLSVPENVTYIANGFVSHNTLALSFGNNASNGIEPSFSHHYVRNVIVQGKKTKEQMDVYSKEALLYREMMGGREEDFEMPDWCVTASYITPKEHIDIQAAAQYWIDSSISKSINVPSDISMEDFQGIYDYAYESGLKGCTTFRFNPDNFQGVLVNNSDLENTTYQFTLENGETVTVKGSDTIEYDGETHGAANLFDALKEGLYGKF